ncbi:MAG: MCP four helix bundle domain-containing protein, partial [Noviherbaspirillum sp.]
MKISNLKIGARLGAAFAALLMLMAAMTALGIWELSRVAAAKSDMKGAAYKQILAARWLEGIATNSVRTYAKAKSTDAEVQAYFDKQMKDVSKGVTAIQKELEPLVTTEEGKRLITDVAEKRKAYTGIRDAVFKLKDSGQSNDVEVGAMVAGQMLPAMNAYIASVQKVADYQSSLLNSADADIDAIYAHAKNLLVGTGIAALALGVLLAWTLSRSITRPLGRAVTIARTVAAGDLTTDIEVSSRDEVGQLLEALKEMNANLLRTVAEVRTGTDTIATASKQIAAGNLDLSSRTEEQASSLEETASSMEELTSTVKQNADNARQANQLAVSAVDVAVKGGAVVSQVVGTMAAINESSRKVVDIISVIDGIAFQTNIL